MLGKRFKLVTLALLILVACSFVLAFQSNVPSIFGGYRDRTVYYGTGTNPSSCSHLAGDMIVKTDGVSPAHTAYLQVCTEANTWTNATINVNLSRVAKYTATLTPALVSANTCAEQTGFTVTGLIANDILLVSKPTAQAGLSVAGARTTATNTAAITFCNNTGSNITPTATEVYTFIAQQ
jgi:hypothetical protein